MSKHSLCPSILAGVVLATFTLAVPAHADSTKSLGEFGNWKAFTYSDQAGKVCYTAARATKVTGGEKDRAGTAIAVTHRAKSPNEVSLIGPYTFKKESEADVQLGSAKYVFFTRGGSAWAKDSGADKTIIAALAKGKDLSVKATPAKGAAVVDTIPLKGFAQALAAIDKACGVKR